MDYFCLTDPGKVRDHNEDSVAIVMNESLECLLAVADGMGGHRAGEIASSITINHLTKSFQDKISVGTKEEAISSMSLEDVMNALYEGIAEDEMPMFGEDVVINEDNVEWYLGTTEAVFDEGLAREPLIGSIAHSTVLLRVEDEKQIDATMELVRNSVNTNKWVCVGIDPSELVLEKKGNVILMIIDAVGIKDTMLSNFENI